MSKKQNVAVVCGSGADVDRVKKFMRLNFGDIPKTMWIGFRDQDFVGGVFYALYISEFAVHTNSKTYIDCLAAVSVRMKTSVCFKGNYLC